MDCTKIICVDRKPKEHKKLFFGEYGKFVRIDKIQFENIKKLYEASEGNSWFMNEIDYTKDSVGWKTLIPEIPQRMFKLNINYQNLMDSAVPNVFNKLADISSLSELEYLYSRIGIEERIHSLTYSNGLSIVFGSEAEEILDLVYTDDVIKARMQAELDTAEEFIQKCIVENRTDDEAKKALLKMLLRTFLLEGIKFPFSFFVTWTINNSYNNAIQGFARALKLIAWDEMTVHTTTGSTVMGILLREKEQEFSHLEEWFKEYAIQAVKETVESEFVWNDYLLKDGSIPGYNKEIGEHFIKYWADRRLKELKLPEIYKEKKSDIIDWYNKYRDLNSTTTALQEANATNYQKGKLMNDLDNFDKIPQQSYKNGAKQ